MRPPAGGRRAEVLADRSAGPAGEVTVGVVGCPGRAVVVGGQVVLVVLDGTVVVLVVVVVVVGGGAGARGQLQGDRARP